MANEGSNWRLSSGQVGVGAKNYSVPIYFPVLVTRSICSSSASSLKSVGFLLLLQLNLISG